MIRNQIRVGLVAGLVLTSALILARSLLARSPYGGNSVTARYAELAKTRGFEAARQYARDTLTSLLGGQMPEFVFSRADHSKMSLSTLHGSSLALLWADTGCPAVDNVLTDLSSKNWQWPGYDRFIVLLKEGRQNHYTVLPGKENVGFVQWPLPGKLGCVSMTPTMMFVDNEGRFVGFKLGTDDAVFWNSASSGRHEILDGKK